MSNNRLKNSYEKHHFYKFTDCNRSLIDCPAIQIQMTLSKSVQYFELINVNALPHLFRYSNVIQKRPAFHQQMK